jgi:hypothetical protein
MGEEDVGRLAGCKSLGKMSQFSAFEGDDRRIVPKAGSLFFFL